MNKGKLIVANWKMNFLYNNALSFCRKISLYKNKTKNKFVICPPNTLILNLSLKFKKISFGAQDCHYENFGAYTGDVSAKMLKNINCKYVIIGHSERRIGYHEDDILLKNKLDMVLRNGLIPIYCIGENIKTRKKGKTKNFISKQLLKSLPKKNKKQIIIAYEPIWAIGSGVTPSIKEIEKINLYIKKTITKINRSYKKTTILYGGSVNKDNSPDFLNSKEIDGLLVGGASLDFNKFTSILNCK